MDNIQKNHGPLEVTHIQTSVIIIHVVIMDCVLLVGAKVLSPQGPPVK